MVPVYLLSVFLEWSFLYVDISALNNMVSFSRTANGAELTANFRTKILDIRGSASSRILVLRGGIIMPVGNLLESSSQRILAGIVLVGRSGAAARSSAKPSRRSWMTSIMACYTHAI